jgi:MerR family redox-sensitive transcriptional activator SoxR
MQTSGLSIGEVAGRAGLRASAVRFYEKEGLLPKPARSGGRRVYGESILERLAVIEFAKQSGFRVEEIRRLLQGSPGSEPVSLRWQALVRDKLEELKVQQQRIAALAGSRGEMPLSRCGGVRPPFAEDTLS